MEGEVNESLTHIDLFSGIGGFTLAAEWAGFRTVVFCEKEEFCQKVLKKRFGAVIADSKHLRKLQSKRSKQNIGRWSSNIPIIPEIRDFDGTKYRGATLLTGGFPCQPFSYAGKQKGKEDDRYLWPEMFRIIKEAKPRWILAENVTGIIKLALGQVLSDLESIGYDFPRDHEGTPIVPVIPACGLNAPHRRNRVWIVGYSTNDGYSRGFEETRRAKREGEQGRMRKFERANSHAPDSECLGWQERTRNRIEHEKQISKGQDIGNGDSEGNAPDSQSRDSRQQTEQKRREDSSRRNIKDVADSERILLQGFNERQGQREFRRGDWEQNWHEVAARFCRVDDGVSDRIHRLKALGNAIVPQIAFEILKNIAWIENERNIP